MRGSVGKAKIPHPPFWPKSKVKRMRNLGRFCRVFAHLQGAELLKESKSSRVLVSANEKGGTGGEFARGRRSRYEVQMAGPLRGKSGAVSTPRTHLKLIGRL